MSEQQLAGSVCTPEEDEAFCAIEKRQEEASLAAEKAIGPIQSRRERFEAWAHSEAMPITRAKTCDYADVATQWAWEAWQAACPEGFQAVPSKITAETGHKYALIGEFSESFTLSCPECDEEEPDEHCEICLGVGEYEQPVPIEWDTIKHIHDRIVSVSAPPQSPC